MNLDVILWGASGHAKVLRECLRREGHQVVALFDNNPQTPAPFSDIPLVFGFEGFESWLAERKIGGIPLPHFLVAIGGNRGVDRLELDERISSFGLNPFTTVHPTAFLAPDARVGGGSQILAHATVSVEVEIGRQCIINHASSVDHECFLEDGVHVCPGATLAGLVRVGRGAMIGTGAVILPRRVIGEGAVIGAGAVVTRDVAPGMVVVGNPARVIRSKAGR